MTSLAKMCNKKFVSVCLSTGLFFVVLTVYMAMFRHPPAAVILAANNRAKQTISEIHKPGDPDYDPYDEAEKAWDNFIICNGYVPIGSIFDKCDKGDRFMIGKVILTPDLIYGGVMSRIFVNMTLEETVHEGTFYLHVHYNGQDIYENHFEVCYKDDSVPNNKRPIACPITEGFKTYDQLKKVPNYIPKGHYSVKGRVTDAKDNILVCAEADFVL